MRLGWSSPTFGAGDDRLIVQGSAAAGWRPGPRQLLLASGSVRSRLWQGVEDLLAGGRLRYYRRNPGGRDHLFYALLEAQAARDLDPEDQLLPAPWSTWTSPSPWTATARSKTCSGW